MKWTELKRKYVQDLEYCRMKKRAEQCQIEEGNKKIGERSKNQLFLLA